MTRDHNDLSANFPDSTAIFHSHISKDYIDHAMIQLKIFPILPTGKV